MGTPPARRTANMDQEGGAEASIRWMIGGIRLWSGMHGREVGCALPPDRVSQYRVGKAWLKSAGIKLEGFVHPGVYRFWIDGLRRWLSGAVKWNVVEK